MTTLPTVSIRDIARPTSLPEALATWSGFAELAPVSSRIAKMRHLLLDNADDASWRWAQLPDYKIGPLGCFFIRDLQVCGSGYLFHRTRFVCESVNISEVALRWLKDLDFYDNPFTHPRPREVMIDEPVLMVFGPGSRIYGHWLLDFLPRIVIAQQLLGDAFAELVLLLPEETPDWVLEFIGTFCGIPRDRFRSFSGKSDMVTCRRACVPTYAHCGRPGNYALHALVRSFYDRFGHPNSPRAKRSICLSRRAQEQKTFGVWRVFDEREQFEAMAAARGFEIVRPEELSFPDQVELFRGASCIVGEQGSGMHAAVFADPGTIVATVGPGNWHQVHIANAFEQRAIAARRHKVLIEDHAPGDRGARPARFSVSETDMAAVFELVDRVKAGDLSDPSIFLADTGNSTPSA